MGFDGKKIANTFPEKPGIYQMYGDDVNIIYIGKASNLKKRVSSYFSGRAKDRKTMALVNKIGNVEFSITRNESDALILENQLIKRHKPKFNILLKDGKSYPYIYISENEDQFPRVEFRRGSKKGKGKYFGPFPSAQAVRHTLNHLQKIFKIRQCNNTTFNHRSRPCLQHQIDRCTAPCVNFVTQHDYQLQVSYTKRFLNGKSNEIIEDLVEQMQKNSEELNFEKAASIRDQIRELKLVQSQQIVETQKNQNLDIFSIGHDLNIYIVTLCAVRGGQMLGHRNFYPKVPDKLTDEEVLSSFIVQYYLNKPIPQNILVNENLLKKQILEEALSQLSKTKIQILNGPKGKRKELLNLNTENMKNSLILEVKKKASWAHKWQTWVSEVGLSKTPNRVECFDISHVFGEMTRASCVIFNSKGPKKNKYRNYKITNIQPGDDYAAMKQVIEKRMNSIVKHKEEYPDVLLIDGGKGQIRMAREVIEELGLNEIEIIGISKDENRKAGNEKLFIQSQRKEIRPNHDSLLSHMTQHIRDEAHRFAITGHRKALKKSRKTSLLEGIDGIGTQRRAMLLQYFGGLQGLKKASVDELTSLKGISNEIATRLYEHLH